MNLKEEKTGFKINQKLIQISLLSMALIGTSYYWLDDRPDVYQILWLVSSFVWYVAIFSSIVLICNKIRFRIFFSGDFILDHFVSLAS